MNESDREKGRREAFALVVSHIRQFRERREVDPVSDQHLRRQLDERADEADHLLDLRRTFLIGIAWPAIQLVAAIGIVQEAFGAQTLYGFRYTESGAFAKETFDTCAASGQSRSPCSRKNE